MKKIFATLGTIIAMGGPIATACTIAGPDNAPVVIQEFVDMGCHYCARGAKTMKTILKNYDGQVKLVLRHWPLTDKSVSGSQAMAAACLQNPSLAYALQDSIFENQDQFKKDGEAFL